MITFLSGFLTGVVVVMWFLLLITRKYHQRRAVLFEKATRLWGKASELFETAKIWHDIGNKKDAQDALDEAQKLAQEAQKCEDEANGKETA